MLNLYRFYNLDVKQKGLGRSIGPVVLLGLVWPWPTLGLGLALALALALRPRARPRARARARARPTNTDKQLATCVAQLPMCKQQDNKTSNKI
jgi:hypothetical protein